MSGTSNFDIELAEARVEMERDAGLAKVREALTACGADECIDCGVVISERRRQAMPSARRCADCQQSFEER